MSDDEFFSAFTDFLVNEVDVPLAEILEEAKNELEKKQKTLKT